jgi:2-polyprenyl-3-methyl-5-hydroxy-6-metoxy-1,4-benzoquinol methylase
MHDIIELPAWERLFKKIVWKQLGNIEGKKILDFGSGEGITPNYFAEKNDVTAIEPSEEMLSNAWTDYEYTQIVGDVNALSGISDETFDIIICHNVLEYIDDKEAVIKALARVLKKDGILSIAKHNRAGRVMQMAVLLDDFEKANALLDGDNSTASKFGVIRYYEDDDIIKWVPELTVSDVFGIRTFWDLQQNQEKHGDEDWQDKMIQLEMRVAQIPSYKEIAFFHHLLLKKD